MRPTAPATPMPSANPVGRSPALESSRYQQHVGKEKNHDDVFPLAKVTTGEDERAKQHSQLEHTPKRE